MKKIAVILMTLVMGQMAHAILAVNDSDTVIGKFAEMKCGKGLSCSQVSGRLLVLPNVGAGVTFASGDTTPSVSGAGSLFRTFLNNTVTITGFTNAVQGQEFILISQGAVTLDVTSSNIICGSTDIVTASGDLTRFVFDGAVSRCQGRVRQATAY